MAHAPDEQPSWEPVTEGVDRLPVPGGWICRTDQGVVFVPDKAKKSPTWIPAQSGRARRPYTLNDGEGRPRHWPGSGLVMSVYSNRAVVPPSEGVAEAAAPSSCSADLYC